LPGTPDTEFLLDKSLCLLGKKAQGITAEINARVLAWGRERFNGRLKLDGSKLDRPFTRDAPTSRLVGMRKEEGEGEDINLITPPPEIEPLTLPASSASYEKIK
jgi:hypothetical protein